MSSDNPYNAGYLAGLAGRNNEPPVQYTKAQQEDWRLGYDRALRTTIDSRRRPGERPSLTR